MFKLHQITYTSFLWSPAKNLPSVKQIGWTFPEIFRGQTDRQRFHDFVLDNLFKDGNEPYAPQQRISYGSTAYYILYVWKLSTTCKTPLVVPEIVITVPRLIRIIVRASEKKSFYDSYVSFCFICCLSQSSSPRKAHNPPHPVYALNAFSALCKMWPLKFSCFSLAV